ncbi:Hsp70 family protein [Gordonia westfalica]|uniref:Hsp70 family protein n=1 Tax=Gordonia westfalica TaxID=158898 RepID=A0ABU2GVN9_9ACTN|nr:Hsp70 family protein [Gordonia westfalica]MDS1115475.1 Hsp70 family protein [Gordonia westfalica]
MGVFGVDLGTTNSAIARIDADGRPEVIVGLSGASTTPSTVLLTSATDHVVGEGARREARLDPENVCSLVKRRMGDSQWRFVAHGQTWSAPAISALILKSLMSDAAFTTGEQVERAVITVPAYFGDEERRATIQAGTYAGLDVAGVLSEPIAAALSYGFARITDALATRTPDETVLVYDLGGGTFDATVIELADRRITVLAVDGDHQLGGADWDERLALHLSRTFCAEHPDAEDPLDDSAGSQSIILAAERAKHDLTESDSTSVIVSHDGARSVITVTRPEFEELTRPLMARTVELTRSCLAAAERRGVSKVDRVLLVGGSSRMPMVARELGAALGITPELDDPDLAVARGAATYGEKLEIERLVRADLLTRGRLRDDRTLVDASPADLDESCSRVAAAFALPVGNVRRMLEITVDTVVSRGFGVLAVNGHHGELEASWLVQRNQPLPIRVRRSFGTMRPDQARIELVVLEQQGQAASPRPEDAKVLIEGAITDIPPGYDEGSEVVVTFEMAFDGVLHVTAFHVEAGIPLELSAKTGATLSKSEVERELDQVHRTRRRDH